MLGGLAEFNTAVRHHVDLVVVVFNNGAYGAAYVQLCEHDLDPHIYVFDWPDLAPLATSLGGQGFTVRDLDELELALKAIPDRHRPMLIDIRVIRRRRRVTGAERATGLRFARRTTVAEDLMNCSTSFETLVIGDRNGSITVDRPAEGRQSDTRLDPRADPGRSGEGCADDYGAASPGGAAGLDPRAPLLGCLDLEPLSGDS